MAKCHNPHTAPASPSLLALCVEAEGNQTAKQGGKTNGKMTSTIEFIRSGFLIAILGVKEPLTGLLTPLLSDKELLSRKILFK